MADRKRAVKLAPMSEEYPLRLARAEVMRIIEQGESVICPCCDQFAARYKRRISREIAEQLRWLYHQHAPAHAQDIQRSTDGRERNYSLLVYWGLIENMGAATWQITLAGRAFVEGKSTCREFVFIYAGLCVGFSGRDMTFVQCLAKKFDKAEVMQTGGNHVANIYP